MRFIGRRRGAEDSSTRRSMAIRRVVAALIVPVGVAAHGMALGGDVGTPVPTPVPTPGGPQAASDLRASASCVAAGRAEAVLEWTPAVDEGVSQRVQITIFDFDSQDVDTTETLPPGQSTLIFDQLEGQALHFWRVLTEHPGGTVPSETGEFRGVTCPVDIEPEPGPTSPPIG